MSRLEKDVASDEPKATLEESFKLADALGLSGTPSYVIGSEVVIGAVGLANLTAEGQRRPLRKSHLLSSSNRSPATLSINGPGSFRSGFPLRAQPLIKARPARLLFLRPRRNCR